MNSTEVTELLARLGDRYGVEIRSPQTWIHAFTRDRADTIREAADLWGETHDQLPTIADLRGFVNQRATDHTAATSLAECRRILETADGPPAL